MTGDDKDRAIVDGDEGFLHRWSRRKVEARDGSGQVPAPAENAEKDAETADGTAPDEPEDDVDLEALEKVDIESLDYGADFTAFMKKGVPSALKNRALRQLWRSNPVLANVDGLNDYDEDFNVTDKVLEKFESAYKIGRGYLPEKDESATGDEAVSVASNEMDVENSEIVENRPDGDPENVTEGPAVTPENGPNIKDRDLA